MKREPTTERLDVRLNPDHRRKLEKVANLRGVTVSEAVRRVIEKAYEEEMKFRREKAAEELAGFEVEEVPEPDALSGQLEAAHESPDLH